MRPIRSLLITAVVCLTLPAGGFGAELDDLLSRVRAEGKAIAEIDREREQRFRAEADQQAARLAEAKRTLASLQEDNQRLRGSYQQNRESLSVAEQALKEHR